MSLEIQLKGSGEVSDNKEFTKDAMAMAGMMMKYNDVGHCAKLLEFEYNYAWRLYNSVQYAQARDHMLDRVEPDKLYRKADALVTLIEEATNHFDGTPVSRVAAVKQICDMLGYNAPTEHRITADTVPTIQLALEPVKDGEQVIEVSAEDVADVDGVGEEVL